MKSLVTHHGNVCLLNNFLSTEEADALYILLREKIAWQEEAISIYGRKVKVPRLVAWYGDSVSYAYSGIHHEARPWLPEMKILKRRVELCCEHSFNGMLANLYRDGQDSMGWHADSEKALGTNPFIASLSLGQVRRFKLRHNQTREVVDLQLGHGSLLLMAGELQHHWQHCVPKSKRPMGARINLTFRQVLH